MSEDKDTAPSHSNPPQSWPKVIGAAIAAASLVASVAWGLIEVRGNDVWAPKETTAEHIEELQEYIKRTPDDYVKRTEWLSGQAADAKGIEKFQDEQRQFWSEQRAVNREILNRLPR